MAAQAVELLTSSGFLGGCYETDRAFERKTMKVADIHGITLAEKAFSSDKYFLDKSISTSVVRISSIHKEFEHER